MAKEQQDNRPQHSLRYGSLEAAIWRNEGENGAFHNATFTRHYQTGEEKEWRQTDSFREADLPTLSKLALDSHSVIQEFKRKDAQDGEKA